MKKFLSVAISIVMLMSIMVTSNVASTTASAAANFNTLVWSDEFDGAGVNPYNWTLDQGVRNGERQTYTINNARTENGKLIIKGECTVVDKNGNVMPDGQVSNYTKDVRSASLESNGKQAFKFGKVEIRAKLPNACSAWPAFWTCGYDKYGMDKKQGGSNWPCNGEIDFMEMMCVNSNNEPRSPWGKTNTDKGYESHLHTGPKFIKGTDGELWDGDVNASIGYYDFAIDPGGVSDSEQLAAKWHTYGMIWEKDRIYITFDGAVKVTIDTSNAALLQKAANRVGTGSNEYKAYKTMLETYGNPFNDYEHYFLLNFAIGGGGTEYRFYNDEWPQNLAIDYIRVYQKNDGVSTHNATIKAGTKYTVNGKTYTTYNHRAGKGLTINSAIPSNWVADPKYGGQKVTESDTIPTDTPAASGSSSTIKLADLGNNVQIHTDLQQSALNDKTEKILQYARGAEELSHPKAITLSWTSSVSGTYTVKISENSNLSDGKTYTTTSKSLSLYNLKIGTKYYWQVSCGSSVSSTSSFTTSSSAPRNLYISKVTNCRDIGGWSTGSGSVKQGLLYRTAKLDSISDKGKTPAVLSGFLLRFDRLLILFHLPLILQWISRICWFPRCFPLLYRFDRYI